jgi:hypothetical protein
MDDAHITWLVINEASGSNDAAAVAAVTEALSSVGYSPARTVAVPHDTVPDGAALEAAGVDLLVTFAGDGTVNAVVTGLYGWGGAVLVLPGGTQNLASKAFHGDVPAAEIVARLGRGELAPVRRHMIRSSQGDALCEIVAGPGAKWSDVREAMRESDVGAIASSARQAIEMSASGSGVAIEDPPVGRPEGYAAVRVYPEGAAMAVQGFGPEGWAEWAQQGLALLMRDFREGPHDDLGRAGEVVCVSNDPIELMIDGERKTGAPRERFVSFACDLAFLATASHRPPP